MRVGGEREGGERERTRAAIRVTAAEPPSERAGVGICNVYVYARRYVDVCASTMWEPVE